MIISRLGLQPERQRRFAAASASAWALDRPPHQQPDPRHDQPHREQLGRRHPEGHDHVDPDQLDQETQAPRPRAGTSRTPPGPGRPGDAASTRQPSARTTPRPRRAASDAPAPVSAAAPPETQSPTAASSAVRSRRPTRKHPIRPTAWPSVSAGAAADSTVISGSRCHDDHGQAGEHAAGQPAEPAHAPATEQRARERLGPVLGDVEQLGAGQPAEDADQRRVDPLGPVDARTASARAAAAGCRARRPSATMTPKLVISNEPSRNRTGYIGESRGVGDAGLARSARLRRRARRPARAVRPRGPGSLPDVRRQVGPALLRGRPPRCAAGSRARPRSTDSRAGAARSSRRSAAGQLVVEVHRQALQELLASVVVVRVGTCS